MIEIFKPIRDNKTKIHNTIKRNSGFTLLELLITTSLTVFLMLGITSLFITFLLGNAKTNTKKTVKEEGIHALGQMEFLIRNAMYVDTDIIHGGFACDGNHQDGIKITSQDGGSTIFSSANDAGDNNHTKIASGSGSPVSNVFLTSSAVTLSNLEFTCSGEIGNQQINISFDLEKITPDGTVPEHFNSIVNMRH